MKQQGQFILMNKDEFKEWIFKQNISRKITTIQNHHTYKPSYKDFDGKNHFERLISMDNYHEKDNGWSDIGQNITTFPDGLIAICRPLNVAPAGIYGQNTYGICIEHLGNFDFGGDKMTEEHRKTILFINAILCKRFELPINVESIVYHHWFDLNSGKRLTDNQLGYRKTCPGTNWFGGNKIVNAIANFIPLVKLEYEKLSETKKVEVPVKVNDKVVSKGLIINDLTYIPIRSVGEILGATVHWDSASDKTYLNGILVPKNDLILIDNVNYVPLRKFGQMLGVTVIWDGAKREVLIKK